MLDWLNAAFGSISKAGTDGDGILTLGAGVALLVGGLIKQSQAGKTSRANILIVLAALAAAAIAIYDISDVSNLGGNEFVSVSVGPGLYVVLVGAIIGVFGASGVRGTATSPHASFTPPPPPPV